MTANLHTKLPKFLKIKEILREQILVERLPAGTRMPSEPEISRKFGVSTVTARRALSELASDGYVVREHGRGTFVADRSRPPVGDKDTLSLRYVLVGRHAADPFFSSDLQSFVEAASDAGADLVCREISTEQGHQKAAQDLRALLTRPDAGDGVFISGDLTEKEILDLQRLGIPFVFGGALPQCLAGMCDWVTADHHALVDLLLDHLVQLGHRHIGYIGGDVASGWPIAHHAATNQLVREGFLAALGSHHLSLHWEWVVGVKDAMDPRESRRAALRLLSGQPRPTAIICAGRTIAPSTLDGIAELGLSIPADVSVACLGGLPKGHPAEPFLTVAVLDANERARQAIRLLLERIRDGRTEPRGGQMQGHLVVRQSTDHPPLDPGDRARSEGVFRK